MDALDTDGDGEVSELEYMRFMLVAMKKVDVKLFDDLHDQFLKMDIVGDGKITQADLKIMAVRKMRKVQNKLALGAYKVRSLSETAHDRFSLILFEFLNQTKLQAHSQGKRRSMFSVAAPSVLKA